MLKTGFENLRVYQLALELAEAVWQVLAQWDFMTKDTVGKPFSTISLSWSAIRRPYQGDWGYQSVVSRFIGCAWGA